MDPSADRQATPSSLIPGGEGDPAFHGEERASRAALRNQARIHYKRGNRFFGNRHPELARAEWRQAGWLWQVAAAPRKRSRPRLLDLRAVVLLLLTVLLVFNLVYGLFPRNIADIMAGADEDAQVGGLSWWERWLDTGHPSAPGAPSVTLREWWQRMQQRWRTGSEESPPETDARQDLDDRYEELISRFRPEPLKADPIDFRLISGFGFLRAGDYERAVRAFQMGLADAKRPRHRADLYQGLANAYYYGGYHPGPDGLARYDLPLVRKAADAYEQAAVAEERALSIGNLGWMYFLLGDYERAERNSLRALSLDKNLLYVRLNLGLTLLAQNRIEDAYGAYRTVIRSQPDDEVLVGGMNDLREMLRDKPDRYPYADLMLGLLAQTKGDLGLAESALQRFLASPDATARWRVVAEKALKNLNAPADL